MRVDRSLKKKMPRRKDFAENPIPSSQRNMWGRQSEGSETPTEDNFDALKEGIDTNGLVLGVKVTKQLTVKEA